MVVFDGHEYLTEEEKRLKEDRERTKYWKKWGSYLSERQWATGRSCTDASCLSTLLTASQFERTIALTVTPGAVCGPLPDR